MSIFDFFNPPPAILIKLGDKEYQPIEKLNNIIDEGHYSNRTSTSQFENCAVYYDQENIQGIVTINSKRMEHHSGIKIELIGEVVPFFDRGNNMRFLSLVRELSPLGTLSDSKNDFEFDFSTAEKPYESYFGINLKLRYFLRVTLSRKYGNNVTEDKDISVRNYQNNNNDVTLTNQTSVNKLQIPESVQSIHPIRLEIGIEDCLHIEFDCDKHKYHLNDVIKGKVLFGLVRIKISTMQLCIVKKETCSYEKWGPTVYNESQNIIKYELMDGIPIKGESIPFRLYLTSIGNLTPTYRSIHNLFSVKYFLNLVLIDEDDRRYFKQQEIIFYRCSQPAD